MFSVNPIAATILLYLLVPWTFGWGITFWVSTWAYCKSYSLGLRYMQVKWLTRSSLAALYTMLGVAGILYASSVLSSGG
jgi:hypothetical protein